MVVFWFELYAILCSGVLHAYWSRICSKWHEFSYIYGVCEFRAFIPAPRARRRDPKKVSRADQKTVPRYEPTIRYCICHLDLLDSKHADWLLLAESKVVEEEKEENVVKLTFVIQHHVGLGESLLLSGSVRELGDWDIARAIPLQWAEGDVWRATVCVKRSTLPKMEYKYIVKCGAAFRWEGGRNHLILRQPVGSMDVEDFWEFPGFNRRQPSS